jgi:putative ABC transport system substrate-binding protein
MRRRELITLLGGAAVAPTFLWLPAARAQQPALPAVGFLYGGSRGSPDSRVDLVLRVFHQGLAESGFVEGRNVAIEYRWAEYVYDRLPGLAADLVRRQVAVIVSIGGPAGTLAARAATTTIPIVFSIGGDPVRLGLVTSLNRPGGNLTGITNLNTEVLPKRLELLHELTSAATSVAALVNPTSPAAETQSRDLQAAAAALGLQLHVLHASSEREFDAVFATLARLRAGGLVIAGDGLFVDRSEQLGALALRHATPAIFQFREFAAAGGLMSYGRLDTDGSRLVGVYAGRILKGEKPADLPVQQSTKIELIINLKTATALGLAVPPALLARADEVIE